MKPTKLNVIIKLYTDGDFSLKNHTALGFSFDGDTYEFQSKELDMCNIEDLLGMVLNNIHVGSSHLYIWHHICELFAEAFDGIGRLFREDSEVPVMCTMGGNYDGTEIYIAPMRE